jgi:hypothetical protein
MAKFLTTVGNSFYVEQIILNAEKNLTLVTPYLNLSKNLIERLTDADKENIKITLVYGKSELNKTEKKKIESLNNIEIYFCENLHAKCYLNEQSMIITSMNLYEFSERNNREMGILFEKEKDSQIFIDTLKEIESIKNSSELKKSPNRNDLSDLIYLSSDKNEIWDLYYPSLYRVLKNRFVDYKVQYDNESHIIIENFPIKGVELKINGRIDFDFENESFYDFLKKNYRQKIRDSSPGIRFFWNYCLNIYPEKNFEIDVNKDGLDNIVLKYLKIIENTQKQITIANTVYN